MTFIPKEAIEVIAQSIGITNLSSDVALAVAPDVEYRIREIMQEAIKCMRHARRTVLRAADVDGALMLRNVEPIYGFGSSDSLRFKRADGLKDLYYIEDKEVEFKDVLAAPLPKAPIETSVTTHWLAIEGVQPAIQENAPVEAPAAVSDGKRSDYREDGLSADIKVPVKPVLSRELQFYFDKIKQLTVNRSNSILFRQALTSLATSSGIQPLVPFFTCFIADEVTRSLTNFPLLFALMRVARSLLQNPHLHIELYLHQMIPSIMTCLVSKRLGNRFSDNHWDLRNFAANMIALICKRFGHAYHNLQSRVTRTLLHAFLDPTKSLPQHYGAIQGLAALGTSVVRLLILPNLEPYLQLLEPEMHFEEQKNEMKRTEAWRVYGALQHAAGLCVYDRLRKFPRLLTLPTRSCLKRNERVRTISATSCSTTAFEGKRKASMDNLMHQPPLKKMAAGGAMGLMPVNSMSVDMSGPTGGFPNIVGSSMFGGSSVGISTMPRQIPKENMLGREMDSRASKTSTVLAQAWREDMEGGQLLASLFELFGESMFRFTPKSELLLFL